MPRSINLDSLYEIINDNIDDDNRNYRLLQNLINSMNDYNDLTKKIQVDINELKVFQSLHTEIGSKMTASQKCGWFYSYKNRKALNQEFDLIRFSDGLAVNIELKTKRNDKSPESWKKKLVRQNNVLKVNSNRVENFLYVFEEHKIYKLICSDNYISTSDSYKLCEIDFDELIKNIPEDYAVENRLDFVKASDLIISPYNEAHKFINGKYFLNSEQDQVFKSIYKSDSKADVITGGAGTGKSIILFEIAKLYKANGKRPVLVFCGILDNYLELKEIYGFDIFQIKSIIDNYECLEDYDVVLLDEFQRIRSGSYAKLKKLNFKKVVFCIDQQQTVHKIEVNRDINKILMNDFDIRKHKLSNKIRQNKEMSDFIKMLLNARRKGLSSDNFRDVSVSYFSNEKNAIEYLDNIRENEDFTVIELTEYSTKSTNKLQRKSYYKHSKNIHEVIGREFNNVAVIFDKYIVFDENAELSSNYKNSLEYRHYPYDEHNSYFEALTRVRDNLELIIINNKELYLRILEILNWWKVNYEKMVNINNKLKKENEELKKQVEILKM